MKLRLSLLFAVLVLGPLAVITAAPSASANVRPVNLGSPTITGFAQVGKVLTASRGTWAGTWTRPGAGFTTYTYEWLREGELIPGATGSTYEPEPPFPGYTSGDLGFRISVRVTAHKPGFQPVSAESARTGPVQEGLYAPETPKITGLNRVGEILTVDVGNWVPDPMYFSFTWYANNVQVKNAVCTYSLFPGCYGDHFTYAPQPADVGKQIKVVVEGSGPGYKTAVRTAYAGFTKPAL